ncbi:hypothetical protein [Streptomyces humi]
MGRPQPAAVPRRRRTPGAIALALALPRAMYQRLPAAPVSATPDATPAPLRGAVRRDLLHVLVLVTAIPLAYRPPDLAKYWWVLTVVPETAGS